MFGLGLTLELNVGLSNGLFVFARRYLLGRQWWVGSGGLIPARHVSAETSENLFLLMQKSTKTQVCFPSSDGLKLLCNVVDRDGDGQMWETRSGKWIPIPLDYLDEKTPSQEDVDSEEENQQV